MINKWNFQTPSEEELHKRDQLVAELGFSPVICLLLVQRGITSIEEAKKFFKPSLNDLHDPFLMPDMDKAVRRLNKALGNKEKILIYGDYDVDENKGCKMLGDKVNSMEREQEKATLYGHPLKREGAFLTVHSMLHLLGYDHENGGLEAMRMREKEEAVLTQLGLPRTVSYTE